MLKSIKSNQIINWLQEYSKQQPVASIVLCPGQFDKLNERHNILAEELV